MSSHQWPKSIQGKVRDSRFFEFFVFVPAGLVKLQIIILSLCYKYAHRRDAQVYRLLENTNFITMLVK